MDQGDERFTVAESHSGLGRARNMKVCLVVSKSRLLQNILLLNSPPSRCPSCPSFPLSPFLPSHLVSLSAKLERNVSKRLKIDFPKKRKTENTFSGVPRLPC